MSRFKNLCINCFNRVTCIGLLFCITSINLTIQAQQKRSPIWEAGLQYNLPADTVNVKVVREINYQKDRNEFTTLDIYQPSKANSPTPVVILIHGGPVSPEIAVKPKDWKVYTDYGKLIASKGVIAVVINHRMFDNKDIEQSRKDILAAIDFIKINAKQYQVNPTSISLWLFSFGGQHFDFFAQQKDSAIKAMISFYGFLSAEKQPGDSSGYIPPQLIVRSGLDKPDLLAATDSYISKAIKMNYPIEIVNYKNGVHAFDIFQKSDETTVLIDKAIDFLKLNLFKPDND